MVVGDPTEEAAHLWRFPERDCLVCVPAEVLEAMRKMATEAAPRETGGTLVGYYSTDFRIAFVVKGLEAKTGARRRRTRFYRPPDDVDDQLTKIYRESEGRVHYLGEWHTHPRAAACPSPTDIETLRGLARSRSVATDTPFMVIMGGDFRTSHLISCTLAEKDGRCLKGVYEQKTIIHAADNLLSVRRDESEPDTIDP